MLNRLNILHWKCTTASSKCFFSKDDKIWSKIYERLHCYQFSYRIQNQKLDKSTNS